MRNLKFIKFFVIIYIENEKRGGAKLLCDCGALMHE